jgi:hypothetical protein
MGIGLSTIDSTVINFAILIAIIIGIYKAIQEFKNYVNRNKEMERGINIIPNKLENKHFIIRILCRITYTIIAICFLNGIESVVLLPFVFINTIIYRYNQEDNIPYGIPKKYARYDGLKKALSIIVIFWIIVIAFLTIHNYS